MARVKVFGVEAKAFGGFLGKDGRQVGFFVDFEGLAFFAALKVNAQAWLHTRAALRCVPCWE